MSTKNNHTKPFINWTDGMKINKTHFIDLEDAIIEKLQSNTAIRTSPYNYGLLQPYNLDVDVKMLDETSVQVHLKNCKALTEGGYVIDISDRLIKDILEASSEEHDVFQTIYDLEKGTEDLYIIVNIEPFKRLLIGAPSSEHPIRHPYTIPTHSLEVLSKRQFNINELGDTRLPIAKLVITTDSATLDKDYIPPCVSLNSHPKLIKYHEDRKKDFEQLLDLSLKIVEKIHNQEEDSYLAWKHNEKNKDKKIKRTYDISHNIGLMAERTANYLSSILAEFSLIIPQKPPVYMITAIVNLAYNISGSIDCLPPLEKTSLYQYYGDKTSMVPGDYYKISKQLRNINYDHTDISDVLVLADSFLTETLSLFKELVALEYVGFDLSKVVEVVEDDNEINTPL